MTISAPASANARAIARPRPLLPPGRGAVRPVRLNKSETGMGWLRVGYHREGRYGRAGGRRRLASLLEVNILGRVACSNNDAAFRFLGIGIFLRDIDLLEFHFWRCAPSAGRRGRLT